MKTIVSFGFSLVATGMLNWWSSVRPLRQQQNLAGRLASAKLRGGMTAVTVWRATAPTDDSLAVADFVHRHLASLSWTSGSRWSSKSCNDAPNKDTRTIPTGCAERPSDPSSHVDTRHRHATPRQHRHTAQTRNPHATHTHSTDTQRRQRRDNTETQRKLTTQTCNDYTKRRHTTRRRIAHAHGAHLGFWPCRQGRGRGGRDSTKAHSERFVWHLIYAPMPQRLQRTVEQTCLQVAASSLQGFMSVFSVCLARQGIHVHALACTWPFFYVPLASGSHLRYPGVASGVRQKLGFLGDDFWTVCPCSARCMARQWLTHMRGHTVSM